MRQAAEMIDGEGLLTQRAALVLIAVGGYHVQFSLRIVGDVCHPIPTLHDARSKSRTVQVMPKSSKIERQLREKVGTE